MAEKVCEACGGTGWIVRERDGLSGAERCGCGFEGRAKRLEEASRIPPLYGAASLENFLLPKENPLAHRGLGQVMQQVSSFVRFFPDEKRPGLLLIGEPGCGKTHLAVAALRMLMARGFEGLFFDYQNLLDRIRAGYDAAAGQSDREAYRFALDAEILLLDDLGAHRVSDWVEDTVTSIITHRCNHRKPLIATTNLPDPEAGDALAVRSSGVGKMEYRTSLAERVGERARSRLFEMCKVIRMPLVEDYRLRKVR